MDHNDTVPRATEQIEAILGWNTFHSAVSHLPQTKTMDDVRFSDFIPVTEDEVHEHVVISGLGPLS